MSSSTTRAEPRAEALADAVRVALRDAGDPVRAAGQQAYMKSAMPFRGVRLPELRRVCRPLFVAHPMRGRDEWEHAVRLLWDGAAHREERYAAIDLTGHQLYRSYQDLAALPLYEHMIVTGAWWDHVDPLASDRIGPMLRAFPAELAPVLRTWAVDDDVWRRRTSIIAQLGSTTDTDVALLADCIVANLDHRDFFVRKAIGWALRQYARTDPGWVRAFVDSHADRMSALSRREATKHL
jgi:3-methyladenine DNA glycosylase AlkD